MNIVVKNNKVNNYFGEIISAIEKEKELFIYGGAGSGKSYAVAQALLLMLLTSEYMRCIYMRKVARTIRNSQFQLFCDVIKSWKLEGYFEIKSTDMSITCVNGNSLIAAGADDVEKLKSIQEPSMFWLEEATEFTQKDYTQIRLRLRTQKGHNAVISTFNPINSVHWIKSYLDKRAKDLFILKTTYLDNKFIDSNYKETLNSLQTLDADYFKVYALGEWGSGDKSIVYNYTVGKFNEDANDIFYGLDFGFVNPTALVECRKVDNTIYVRQLLYSSNLTNSHLIEKLRGLIKKNKAQIFCDSEDKNRIEELYNDGFNVYTAYKNVQRGISIVNSFNIIVDENSSDLIKEISMYAFMKDKNGNTLEQPIKFNDHLMDAMRYAIATRYKEKPFKPKIKIY